MKVEKIKRILIEAISTILICVVALFILNKFILISVVIEGNSMQPTLNNGDYGFSFIISKNMGINRFDIVVIDTDKIDKRLVKRVIGLPNETVKYYDNELYINDTLVEEDFLDDKVLTPDFEISLGENEYFVLGDNREISKDSRYYGSFNYEDFLSSNIFVLWPSNDTE